MLYNYFPTFVCHFGFNFFALLVYIVLATYVIEHVFHYNNNYIYILKPMQQ